MNNKLFFYGSFEDAIHWGVKDSISRYELAKELIACGIGADNLNLLTTVRGFRDATFSNYRKETNGYNPDVRQYCNNNSEAFIERVKKYFETNKVMRVVNKKIKNDMIVRVMQALRADSTVSPDNRADMENKANIDNFGTFMAEAFAYAIIRQPSEEKKLSFPQDETTGANLARPSVNTGKISNDVRASNLYLMPAYFSDPHKYLERIKDVFLKPKIGRGRKPRVLYLTGEKGTGKRSVAIEFGWNEFNSEVYKTVWEFTAEDELDAEWCARAFLHRVGVALPLPVDEEDSVVTVSEAFRNWFNENNDWLLIFCYKVSGYFVRDYIPEFGKGHIIITTRHTPEPHEGCTLNEYDSEDAIDIEPFPLPYAAEFLLDCLRLHEDELDDSEREAVKRIVEKLKGLPGRLVKTADYISKYKEGGFKGYLDILEHFEQYENAALEKRFENFKKAS